MTAWLTRPSFLVEGETRRLVGDFGDEYALEMDSQDVVATLEMIGCQYDPTAFSLFVLLDESGADYAEVWLFPGKVAYVDKVATLIATGAKAR